MGGLALYSSEPPAKVLLRAGKPLALLVYLALAPDRRARRQHVAELLWHGRPMSKSLHCLRQALYRLRRGVGGRSPVRSVGEDLQADSRVRLACLEGEAAAASGDLSRAYELLRGDFLGDFSVPGSVEFESWVESQRLRFRATWAQAAEVLAERRLAAGDVTGALEVAEALVARYPLDAAPMRLVMAALAAAGRHGVALARFRAHQQLLLDELDDEPEPALREYARELESCGGESRVARDVAGPLVGRGREWAILEEAWRTAREWEGSAIVMEGPPGSGRSRLLSEFGERVRSTGAAVLSAQCSEIEASVPYAAIGEALQGITNRQELRSLDEPSPSETAGLLPDLRASIRDLSEPGRTQAPRACRLRLHEALAQCCRAVAEQSGLLLTLDDLQWADRRSLEALYALCRRLRGTRCLAVVSYQPTELRPPVHRFVRSLIAAGLVRPLSLRPLSKDDVKKLFAHDGESEASPERGNIAGDLHRFTGGSRLLLSRVLESLREGDIVTPSNGRWHLQSHVGPAEAGAAIRGAVSSMVDALEDSARTCLEGLAASDGPVEASGLARFLGVSEVELRVALDGLEKAHLVRRVGLESYQMASGELRRLVTPGSPGSRREACETRV